MKNIVCDDYNIFLDIEFDADSGCAMCKLNCNPNISITQAQLSVFEFVGGECNCVSECTNKSNQSPLFMTKDFQCESGVAYRAQFDAVLCIESQPVPISIMYDALCA